MQLGMVGLGRMGANMVRRLMHDGHECVVYDVSPDSVATLVAEGAVGSSSMEDFASKLTGPRTAWMMVPAAYTASTAEALAALLGKGDIIVDGGNSYYRDDIDTAARLAERGIHYVDCGTSGGVFGLERGYCLMVGGTDEAVAHLARSSRRSRRVSKPLRARPATRATPRPPSGAGCTAGPSGAGHFVKMVHNGIEYGLMAAYAEGLAILRHADAGNENRAADAETTPLRDPQYYQYELDIPAVTEVWRRGSVVASWLLDLTAKALHEDPDLSTFGGRVSDSGEGRWTVLAAVDEGVPAHVITAALYERFSSRGNAEYADKVLSAMRKEFGGHHEKPADGSRS